MLNRTIHDLHFTAAKHRKQQLEAKIQEHLGFDAGLEDVDLFAAAYEGLCPTCQHCQIRNTQLQCHLLPPRTSGRSWPRVESEATCQHYKETDFAKLVATIQADDKAAEAALPAPAKPEAETKDEAEAAPTES